MNRFNFIRSCAIGVAAFAFSHTASAAVSAQEAAQLGTTLTPWGAEKAGSADGLIPAYTGGNTTPPAGFVPGSGRYPNPYADEKPIVSINAANLAQFADKVSPGIQALIKRFPGYHIDVYPTHRSVHYPDFYVAQCEDNATHAQTTAHEYGYTGAKGCVPFPIPKTGLEVIWNMLAHDATGVYVAQKERSDNYMVDSSGTPISIGNATSWGWIPYLDPSVSSLSDGYMVKDLFKTNSPASQSGTKILIWYSSDFNQQDQLTWIYEVGQRRVRIAPEFRYDTPIATNGGAMNWDELEGFSGKPDRFNFKLLGKKELYIPYNNYKDMFGVEPLSALGPSFEDPDDVRWELHRVWVVEADLKPNARHVESRRVLYIDEDTLSMSCSDGYDHSGALMRVGLQRVTPYYDDWGFSLHFSYYDLSRNYYMVTGLFGAPSSYSKHFTTPEGGTEAFTVDGMTVSSFQ